MQPKKNKDRQIFNIVLMAVGALLLLRFLLYFRFAAFLLVSIGLVGWGGYMLFRYWQQYRAQKAYADSVEGVVHHRMETCRIEIGNNRREIEEIRKNIRDLEGRLEKAFEATSEKRAETENLIRAFREELNLRLAKITFLERCIHKLKTILHNHELSSALERKQGQLKRLREKNYEDLANLEALRSDIEYDQMYLQTIDELTGRLHKSQSLEHVQVLKKELEEMTKELDDEG